MTNNKRKQALIQSVMGMECIPIMPQDINAEEYTKVPMSHLSSLGASFAAMVPVIKQILPTLKKVEKTAEPLFRMVLPQGVQGTVNSVGNIVNETGKIVGRARYYKVTDVSKAAASIDPVVLITAIAISSVTKKLDYIEEAQKEIIEFLELKEKSTLKGNALVLQAILEEYKYNSENEKFKSSKYIQVQEIKRDSEQKIIFYRERVEKRVNKKKTLHSDRDVKTKIQKVENEFKDYEIALYLYSFSSFLEVMLLENFNTEYLNSVVEKLMLYAEEYHALHVKCYDVIEGDSKTTIQASVLKGVAGFNRSLGRFIGKIPKIRDGQMDENLIEAGDRVEVVSARRTEDTMELFNNEFAECVYPFIENIQLVNHMFNQPIDVLIDNDTVYYKLIQTASQT